MTKWKNKTPEEKAKTLKNIEKNKETNKPRYVRKVEEANKLKLDILHQGEIPLNCRNCGPTMAEHYTLIKGQTLLGVLQMIEGDCKKCGRNARMITDMRVAGPEISIILTAKIMLLNMEGRITDDRNGEVREMFP